PEIAVHQQTVDEDHRRARTQLAIANGSLWKINCFERTKILGSCHVLTSSTTQSASPRGALLLSLPARWLNRSIKCAACAAPPYARSRSPTRRALSVKDGSLSTRRTVARSSSTRTCFPRDVCSTETIAPAPNAAIRRALLSRSE